jgi:peptidoglycan/xylan/chitin deacetylase (PgdA/CDA1 family)
MAERLLVFGWHNVEPSWFFPCAAGAGLRGLERQLRWLERGANVVSLREALDALSAGRRLPPRAVAITFDDGYRDALELAVPMLERLGLPATFLLVPGFLSRAVQPWWELLAWAFSRTRCRSISFEGQVLSLEPAVRKACCWRVAESLKRRDLKARGRAVDELIERLEPTGSLGELILDWDGARQLARRGFEIGSHSMDHAILSEEDFDEQRRNLRESRQQLLRELGVHVDILAYPNGTERDYDPVTIAAAAAAGYRYAVTTRPGWNGSDTPPYEVRRFVVDPQRGARGLHVVSRHAFEMVTARASPGSRRRRPSLSARGPGGPGPGGRPTSSGSR